MESWRRTAGQPPSIAAIAGGTGERVVLDFEVSEKRPGLRITRLSKDLILLSVPSPKPKPATRGKSALTPAEQKVVELAVQGLANAAIAEARGCAPRTVANQLASIYTKLRISGRRELKARFHRSR